MTLSLLLIGVAFNVFLAVLVSLKHKDTAARMLILVALSLIFWEVSNYLADYAPAGNLLWNRLTFIGPPWIMLFGCLFIAAVRQYDITPLTKRLLIAGSTMVSILTLTPLVVYDVASRIVDGKIVGYNPIYGPFYLSYIIWVLLLIVLQVWIAYAPRHVVKGNTSRQSVLQLRMIRIGTLAAILLSLVTNFILPNLQQDSASSQYVPITSIIYIGALSVAILRYRMLDIRFAAIRTLAYLMSIATMAVVYFALAYVISIAFFKESITTDISMSPVNIALALILAFVFQPIKQFFDRMTNQLFYRDRYVTNEFIARLGRILTSTTRLHDVLKKASQEIESTLKSNGSMFLVYRDHHPDAVAGSKIRNSFDDDEYEALHGLVDTFGDRVFVVADYDRSSGLEARKLHRLLAKRGVALVLPLVTIDETIGYLLLGEQMAGGYTRRDIEALETIADSLVIAIQNARSVQVVRDLNTYLEQRVNSATKELRTTNKQLVEIDATKDEFVSMASHQLRTPLTSIKGYLSMVLEGDVGKITPQQRQLLDEAFTSSERMVHLISDFLNVSRLQTGKFVIDRKQADLAKVVLQEVESIKQIAESHGMTIRYRKPSVFPLLYVDDDKLRQVIMNFLDNAIYYSPESRAPISVRLTVEDGYAVFRVADKGMGVPADAQKQLFSKFFRAENARKQRPDGTGIGLYLAKRIIDGHGGKLVFESVEGKGSTFGFRLPIRKLSQPPLEEEGDTKITP